MEQPEIWSLPGPARFIDELSQLLRRRQHVAICRPDSGPGSQIARAVLERTQATWIEDRRILDLHDLCSTPDPPSILSALADAILGKASAGSSPGRFVQAIDAGLLLQVSIDSIRNDELGAAWWMVVHMLAAASNDVDAPFTTVTVCADFDPPVGEAPNVTTRRWYGVQSRLDSLINVTLRLSLGATRPDPVLAGMIAEVALFDVDTADLLIAERWNGDEDALIDLLQLRLTERSPEMLEIAASDPGAAWRLGMLDLWEGADAYSSDSPNARHLVRSRLWSGQASTVFRELEERRTMLLQWAELQGKTPFLDRLRSDPDVEDIHEAEIGSLWKHRAALTSAEPQLRWLRTVRNRLAHREPVSLQLLAEGRQLFDTMSL